jgi:GNAT superfamily N-acetyltransferase
MNEPFEVVRLTGAEVRQRLDELSTILVDCVEGGAGVSFMRPLSRADAAAFWTFVADECGKGRRIVLAALLNSAVVGTVQVILVQIPNQPHRAELAKLLVHRRARERGIARALMMRVEAELRASNRSLLTFDTTTGHAAERLYLSLGYVRAGIIPNYAYLPDGQLCDTSVFYKLLD